MSARLEVNHVQAVTERRAIVADLVELDRPLTARSVLASALLGAPEPTMPVGALVATASLFGITSGAARTCLSRMVANGELTTDGGSYTLTGRLLARRDRVDEAAHPLYVVEQSWDGTWEINVVTRRSRPPLDRLDLRNAATALHLAELREGVWMRPDNLAPSRLPSARAVVADQCVQFRAATTDLTREDVRVLFGLDDWARDARRLIDAIHGELDAGAPDAGHTRDVLTFRFLISIATIRHLQRDSHLPAALLDAGWPADELRRDYAAHDVALTRDLLGAAH
jgi:phenylacetic acid degradation operon negative regulatory protein